MSRILSVVVRWINYDISIGWSFLTTRGQVLLADIASNPAALQQLYTELNQERH